MPWSFSFQLTEGETILEDSSLRHKELVKPVYSVFMTNRRVIFRFDGFGSNLSKSFSYRDIRDVQPTTRLFVGYLKVSTAANDQLFNVHDAEYLAGRIRELKQQYAEEPPAKVAPPDKENSTAKRQALHGMLATLKSHGLLDDDEWRRKTEQLDRLNL